MVLNRLVWNCPARGYRIEQRGLSVRCDPHPSDRVVFFCTDCPDCRRALGIPETQPICDAVITFRAEGGKPILLLVELKGGDVNHAIDQIRTTYGAIRAHLPAHTSELPTPQFLALIVLACGSPPDQAGLKRRLQLPNVKLKILSGRKGKPVDVRPLLT